MPIACGRPSAKPPASAPPAAAASPAWRSARRFTWEQSAFAAGALFLLFSPVVHPWYLLWVMVPALVLGWLITPNVGWLLMCTTTSIYLIYEFMHFCCHIEENKFVRYCPFVNTIRRHHTAHHNQHIMMNCNMNLTFPIADWMFGTSDLNRGLLGHIFNGYSTKYIKKELYEPRRRRSQKTSSSSAALGSPA